MKLKRRAFLIASGSVSVTALSGCSSDGDNNVDNNNTDKVKDSDGDGVIDSQDYAPNDPNVQSKSDLASPESTQETPRETRGDNSESFQLAPNPEVISTAFPEPQAVSTNSDQIRGDTYEFSATIQNTGEAGDIVITLQWLNDNGVAFEDVQKIERYYNSGERRTETFTSELPDNVSRFGFDFVAQSIIATVENSGGSGEVEVELYTPTADTDLIITSTTIQMSSEETQEVELDLDSGTLINDDTEVRATIAD